ncbi:MAG: hypothetical protein QS721_01935 [Candidatus Endonucleobacter sp. (ex Gigantidas childressi)]|nr:hypothetical protein [Candidatus Endonucleobacter sp. (ex Gigantidas childressi)]
MVVEHEDVSSLAKKLKSHLLPLHQTRITFIAQFVMALLRSRSTNLYRVPKSFRRRQTTSPVIAVYTRRLSSFYVVGCVCSPRSLLLGGSRGLAYLLPSSNLKCFGYSYESIYLHIWANKQAGGDLYMHLRRQGNKYDKRRNGKSTRGQIKNRVSIDDHPEIVDDK